MKNQEITKIENKVENAMSEDIKYRIEAAMAGAKEVISVDISPEAVEIVNHNIQMNHQKKVIPIL